MVSGSLALLYFLLGFHGGRQGSGPNRGQSPVEWGDFLSVCPFPPLGHPARSEAQPDGLEGGMDFVPYRGHCLASPHENQ